VTKKNIWTKKNSTCEWWRRSWVGHKSGALLSWLWPRPKSQR
jgi:hypothetical protein